MPPSPTDIIDLPAPKLPGKREELPDLPTPVGPKPRRQDLPDLLAPVGPTSRKLSEAHASVSQTQRPAAVPPPPAPPRSPAAPPPIPPHQQRPGPSSISLPPVGGPKDLPDLLAPVGPQPTRRELPDLLTPVGPKPTRSGVTDLLTPVGPKPTQRPGGVSDLLAPVGPTPAQPQGVSDLLTPVGPTPSQRGGVTGLLTPVGPTPTQRASASDLLAPVGGGRTSSDLLTPVGPTPVHNAPDLLTPVGPTSVRNAPDLLTPVGPTSVRNAPDLLTPVGPEPVRNAPDLLTPVGPEPTRGVELPAPKGFFDEAPPPRPTGKGVAPPLDFDDLDIVPAGTGTGPTPLLDLDSEPLGHEGGSAPFSMDGLDLSPPARAGEARPSVGLEADLPYGQVDLPSDDQGPSTEDSGLVSFARPSGAPRSTAGPAPTLAPTTGIKPNPLAPHSLELAQPVKKKGGTLAGREEGFEAPKVSRGSLAVEAALRKRRNLRIALAAAVLAAVAGGGYYVYSNVELDLGGFKTLPARERVEKIASRMAAARKLMVDDSPGHWYRAAESAEKAAALEKQKTGEPQALLAQAYLAAALDEGVQQRRDREKADNQSADYLKSKALDAQKVAALRLVLDPGKANDAYAQLEALSKTAPKDPDIPLYMGWAALEGRRWDKAQAAFSRALDLAPNRVPALYGLGRALMARGETAKAKDAFQKVFDKHPASKHYGAWLGLVELTTAPQDSRREKELAVLCETAKERETANPRDRSRAWALYGNEAMASSRYELAAERYRIARDLDPKNLDALVGRALAAVEQRTHEAAKSNLSLQDARRDLEAALLIEPGHIGALLGMARVNLLEGRPDEARKSIDAALKIDDKNYRVHYWRGKTLEDPALTDLPGAERAYRRAMELAPNDYAAAVALSQLYLGQAGAADKLGRKADAKSYNDKALEVLAVIAEAAKSDPIMANVLGSAYLGARDLVRAEAWFRAALDKDPGFVDARVNLAATLIASGKLAEAIAEYRKALERDPRREDVALSLAVALEKNKQLDEADRIYKALLSTDGGNVPTLRARAAAGRYFARRGELAKAIEQGDVIAASEPENPAALYLKGLALLEADKLNEAAEPLKRAAAADPQPQYFEAIGRLREKQTSLGEALTEYRRAADLDATYADPLLGMGRVHLARREWPNAIEVLERASRLEPKNPMVWKGIGAAHAARDQYDEAIKAFEQALALNERDFDAHFSIGKAAFNADKRALTVEHLRRAIELAPPGSEELSVAYRLLGYAYRADNKRGEMCAAFRKYEAIQDTLVAKDILFKTVKQELASCP